MHPIQEIGQKEIVQEIGQKESQEIGQKEIAQEIGQKEEGQQIATTVRGPNEIR